MSVQKDKETGLWRCQVRYVDSVGRTRHTTRNGFKYKRDAIKAEKNILESLSTTTELMSQLISEYKVHLHRMVELRNIKQSTLSNKLKFIERYIEPFFNKFYIAKITPATVDEWQAKLSKTNKYGRPMSSGTLRNARSMLNQIFEYGIRNYNLHTNPVVHSQKPQKYSNDKRADHITEKEYKQFYEKIPPSKYYYKVLFNILMYTGLRIGEALALRPMDIDTNGITVSRTLIYSKEGSYFTSPKSKASKRYVPIPLWLYNQIYEYISSIDNISDKDNIFTISESSARHYLSYNAEKFGLPRISPHSLRHSFGSMLYAKSKNMAVVSNIMGHSNTAITAKMYLHSDSSTAQEVVSLLTSPETSNEKSS